MGQVVPRPTEDLEGRGGWKLHGCDAAELKQHLVCAKGVCVGMCVLQINKSLHMHDLKREDMREVETMW